MLKYMQKTNYKSFKQEKAKVKFYLVRVVLLIIQVILYVLDRVLLLMSNKDLI